VEVDAACALHLDMSSDAKESVYRQRDYLAERGPGHKNCFETWSVFKKVPTLPERPALGWRHDVGRFLYSRHIEVDEDARPEVRSKLQVGKLRQPVNTLLWTPCSLNDVEGIEHALKRGANVNARDVDGNTALHRCAERGFIESLSFLLRHTKCDVNAQNKLGSTALHLACRGIEGSWRPGLSKYSTTPSDRRGQSVDVENHARPKLVEMLLWAGADVTIQDKMRSQPLHVACYYGNEAVILKLLEVRISVHSFFRAKIVFHCPVFTFGAAWCCFAGKSGHATQIENRADSIGRIDCMFSAGV